MFFIAGALVLTTAGVFAGKAKFVNQIWASNGTTTVEVSSSFIGTTLSTTVNGTQAKITDHASVAYGLYTDNTLSTPLYSTSAF